MKSFFYRCEVFTPLPGTIGTLQFHVSNLLLALKIVKKQYHALMILYSFRYETFSCGFKVVQTPVTQLNFILTCSSSN